MLVISLATLITTSVTIWRSFLAQSYLNLPLWGSDCLHIEGYLYYFDLLFIHRSQWWPKRWTKNFLPACGAVVFSHILAGKRDVHIVTPHLSTKEMLILFVVVNRSQGVRVGWNSTVHMTMICSFFELYKCSEEVFTWNLLLCTVLHLFVNFLLVSCGSFSLEKKGSILQVVL